MEYREYKELLKGDRSVRRFDEGCRVPKDTMTELVGLTRYCASGRNAQPLKYRIVSSKEECAKVFEHLKWAGYYQDWDGPAEGERPTGYLIQCQDTEIASALLCDDGLQLQAITLGAKTLEIGCCIIKAFNVEGIRTALNIPEHLKPIYVLALGFPAEEVRIVDMKEDGDFKYYRDGEVQCVPKRRLDELIIGS